MFLAALAPELCTVSGPSLERFRALAEAMGLARVVRSMEILGHALVDMREAPDAQVVLEISAVRAVRPDLDSGIEALSERVSVLERAQSGAPAFPRPGAPAQRTASAGADQAAPASAAAALSQVPAAPRPPAEVARKPSIGAMRRSKEGAASPASPTASPEPSPAPSGTAATEPDVDVGAGKPGPAPTAAALDRDILTEAWGDGILQSLPARAKARYASGRFVAVDEEGAHFALPNAAHREQCTEQKAVVEAALSDHFGTNITLVLQIDETASPAAARATPSPGTATAPVPPPADDVEDTDPNDLAADSSGDHASDAEARLLQAFPGASEVPG